MSGVNGGAISKTLKSQRWRPSPTIFQQGTIMEDKLKVAAPKPLTFKIEGKEKHTKFNTEELRRFVEDTEEPAFLADDENGNQSLILVEPLRALFAAQMSEDTIPR